MEGSTGNAVSAVPSLLGIIPNFYLSLKISFHSPQILTKTSMEKNVPSRKEKK
jgi:hypothetical protein